MRKVCLISLCILAFLCSAYFLVAMFVRYPVIADAEYWVGLHLCQRKASIMKTKDTLLSSDDPPTTTVARIVYYLAQKSSANRQTSIKHSLMNDTTYVKHWEFICNGDTVVVECLVVYEHVFEIGIQIDNKKEYYDAYRFIRSVNEVGINQRVHK